MREFRDFRAGPDDEGRRLDKVLRTLLPGLGLSELYGALRKKDILVNGARARQDQRLASGDRITVALVLAERGTLPGATQESALGAVSRLGAMTVFRSPDLLVLDKPRGLLTHGEDSLETLVRAALPEVGAASLAFHPGPLHRLDRNTSGLLAFSLSLVGARTFTEALREGRIRKTYLALVEGRVEVATSWEDELVRDEEELRTRSEAGGEVARALVRPLAVGPGASLLEIDLLTGRTHQVRAQAAHRGHPLLGDAKYGSKGPGPYLLHAWRLAFGPGFLPGLPERLEKAPPQDWGPRIEASLGPWARGFVLSSPSGA